MKLRVWISAFRLRTLPLALSCSVLGSLLALSQDKFRWIIFVLTVSTTLFLQILSNLANDYGDTVNGVDNENRLGPQRATQSGKVSRKEMRIAIGVFAFLSLVSGSLLIFLGLKDITQIILFYVFGIASIIAAIKYTVGKNPYGYAGFGDLFVFIFFGLIGVVGTYYLHTHEFSAWILLPASTIGLFSSGVLNLNNMRDIENDSESGKHTLVVRLGQKRAKAYHFALIVVAIILSVIYTLHFYNSAIQWLFLLTVPLFFWNLAVVAGNSEPQALNSELKKLSLSTFLFSIVFGLAMVL
ncbi:1,4-dihydroxy-2-naphthoate polyprenyltransferase [Maribellus sp. YY47]|uniref:1,4-dihydroxy-2-naphthoate polyprenyltransferase n=1 Tax=Maribellus sp. YY47 TaxID=2929486 RepID=UPI00200072D1|nr:1,4-dihydroxy-2-naphthoate polyprenyltransferase [Maribellus sp. YY47]